MWSTWSPHMPAILIMISKYTQLNGSPCTISRATRVLGIYIGANNLMNTFPIGVIVWEENGRIQPFQTQSTMSIIDISWQRDIYMTTLVLDVVVLDGEGAHILHTVRSMLHTLLWKCSILHHSVSNDHDWLMKTCGVLTLPSTFSTPIPCPDKQNFWHNPRAAIFAS